jgi:hypothetical protein
MATDDSSLAICYSSPADAPTRPLKLLLAQYIQGGIKGVITPDVFKVTRGAMEYIPLVAVLVNQPAPDTGVTFVGVSQMTIRLLQDGHK